MTVFCELIITHSRYRSIAHVQNVQELRNTEGHRRLCKHRQCSVSNINSQINTVALLMLSKYYAVLCCMVEVCTLSKCSWS